MVTSEVSDDQQGAKMVSGEVSENLVVSGMVSGEVSEVLSSDCVRKKEYCTKHQCKMKRFVTKGKKWVRNDSTGLWQYRQTVKVGWRCVSTQVAPKVARPATQGLESGINLHTDRDRVYSLFLNPRINLTGKRIRD